MSLLWPNQLLVCLGADKVTVIYRTGLTKRVLAQKISAQNTVVTAPQEHSGWAQVIASLDAMITQLNIAKRTRVHCTLASDLVRYLVLPPQQVMMSRAEKLAYANAAYLEIYGYVVNDWAIQYDHVPPHQHTVVAAIDQTLVDAIKALSAKHHLVLSALAPYLMSAFNRLNRQVKTSTAMLVLVEMNRLLMVNLTQGVCKQVRSFTFQSDWQATLNEILHRESVLGEHQYRDVLVYAPAQKSATLTSFQETNLWQIKRAGLPAKSTPNDPAFAMLEVFA